MRINNNIFSNSINNVGFNNVGFNNANSIYNINDSLLLSGQNLDYLIPLLLMFLRNMLNSFNNSFSPISMNPIGGFGSPVGGFGNPVGGFGNPVGGFGNPVGGFGNPVGGFGNPVGGFGNPVSTFSNSISTLNNSPAAIPGNNNSGNQQEEYSLDLIKQFEGFSPRAYPDGPNRHSIGYGTRANSPNEVIDQAEAERRMRDHINNYVLPGIKSIIGEDRWNQLSYSQKSALVSLAYNLGVGGSQKILELVRDGKIEQAAEEMKKYVHDSNGQVLAGLVRRRDEESKWLLNANENNNTNQRNNSNESTNVGNNANNSNKDNNTNSNNNVDNNNTQSSQATQNDRNNHRGNNDLNNTNISVVQNLNFHQGDTVNIQFLGYFGRGPVFGNNTFNK